MQKHKNEAFSYEGAGLTAMGQAPKGYYDDRNDCLLGEGEACWQAACTASTSGHITAKGLSGRRLRARRRATADSSRPSTSS